MQQELDELFPPWIVEGDSPGKTAGYFTRVSVHEKKEVRFNLNSRKHINFVCGKSGWKPTEFTTGGNAKIDESVRPSIPRSQETCAWFLAKVTTPG